MVYRDVSTILPHYPFARLAQTQDTAPFEDTSNWHLESEFDRSKARGGGTAVAGGREKSHPTRQGTTESGVEGAAHPDRIWPSSTPK